MHGDILHRMTFSSRLELPVPGRPARGEQPHLGVVGGRVLGHGTLLLHQEAEPPPLLGERRLVAVGHVTLQLSLLAADGINVLGVGDRVGTDETGKDNPRSRPF